MTCLADIHWIMVTSKINDFASDNILNLYFRTGTLLLLNSKNLESKKWERGDYELGGCGISMDGTTDFQILVKEDEPMPEFISDLFFFKLPFDFKVSCKELPYKKEKAKEFVFEIEEY